jgi:photosystem II stability/assembly factor-like uncharacterized protein
MEVYKTTDGGQNWVPKGGGGNGLSFADNLNGMIAASGGRILQTTDGGETWITKLVGTRTWEDVFFHNNIVIAVNNETEIARSTDSGNIWTVVNMQEDYNYNVGDFKKVHWADENFITVTGDGGIVHSTDGGATWILSNISHLDAEDVFGVFCVSATECTGVGLVGLIIHTSDGGITWEFEDSGTFQDFHDVCFTDNGIGIAVGTTGMILRREPAISFGIIAGTVSANGTGLQDIIVQLLDEFGLPVGGFVDVNTDLNGGYSFVDVPVGNYQIMIVEPPEYTADLNPKPAVVIANETTTVDFNLTCPSSWLPTSLTNAPTARQEFEAVWTGSKMIVWDQANIGNTGGIYDPATDTWASITTVNAPPPLGEDYVAVWTGSTMIIWYGNGLGGIYDPAADSWSSISPPNTSIGATLAVWTGSSMIVWGGAQGAIYDPTTDTWTLTSLINMPLGRHDAVVVWTGSKMIVWGGKDGSTFLNTGGIYDPATDSWTPTSTLNAPSGREELTAVWTGSKMIVWGGSVPGGITNTGGIYDPATDTWTPTSMVNAPSPRAEQVAVWTDSKMIIWGGFGPGDNTGGIYDPENDTWTPTPTCNAPFPRKEHVAFWSCATNEMIVWGGSNTVIGGVTNTGGRFSYPDIGCPLGTIAGTASVNSNDLENVLVKLLDDFGLPVDGFDDVYTDANGEYSFTDVPVGDYQVMIVEPLGYMVDLNPKPAVVIANETTTVDYDLTEIVIVNTARSKGYWKHQFDVYVRDKGKAQESEQDLLDYIALVQDHYNLHYDIFTDLTSLEQWQDVLSLRGNHPMVDRAKQHLAALLMNMVSDKIGQYTVVADDGRKVGDVIQYVSELIVDGDDTNDELAKDLAESVNNQQTIAAGIVPEGEILFKLSSIVGEVLTYDLKNNFPNPYNPTTTIKYQIPNAGFVTLKVYDVLGNEVTTLVTENKEPGRYNITFDASELSSGVYIYQLKVNDYLSTKKMVLMK